MDNMFIIVKGKELYKIFTDYTLEPEYQLDELLLVRANSQEPKMKQTIIP